MFDNMRVKCGRKESCYQEFSLLFLEEIVRSLSEVNIKTETVDRFSYRLKLQVNKRKLRKTI